MATEKLNDGYQNLFKILSSGRKVKTGVPMNPKLDAGLAERLRRIFWTLPSGRNGWKNVADEVRRLVKEAKECK